jgi:hypothetical protein
MAERFTRTGSGALLRGAQEGVRVDRLPRHRSPPRRREDVECRSVASATASRSAPSAMRCCITSARPQKAIKLETGKRTSATATLPPSSAWAGSRASSSRRQKAIGKSWLAKETATAGYDAHAAQRRRWVPADYL